MAVPYTTIKGTNGDDNISKLTTSAGLNEIVLALGGNDIISVDFQSVDYVIGGDGEDTVTTSASYSSFSKPYKHPSVNGLFFVPYKGSDGKTVINAVKDIEWFQFSDGKISFSDFLAGKPINSQTTVNLDNQGEITAPAMLDASTGDILYKDDLTLSNFVDIKNFASGDQISIIGKADQISITNDGTDVIITSNGTVDTGNVVINSITLLGVVSEDSIVSDLTTLKDAMGFNAINITIA